MDPTLTPFEELGREVARAQDEALAQPEALAAARQGFLAAAQAGSQRTARRPWLLFAATATAAALVAFLVVVLWPRPIDVQVGAAGRWLAKESYVAAAGATDLPLSFSDGSRLELRAGARARIEQRTRRGAVVVLEHGRMAAAVVHRGNSDWRMRAGPFEVRVTGTRFDLEWDAEKGVLVLTHLEGAVVVTGCQPTESLGLTTGQVLRASCANGRLQLSSSPPVPKLLPVPLPAPVAEVEALAPLAPLVPVTEPVHKTPPTAQPPPPLPEPIVAARSAAPSQPGWKELVRENRFAEAWIAAEENVLAKESEKASATDLLQLADCARFAGNHAWEKQFLLTLRWRFPGSAHAALAAYGIGRVAADARVEYVEAERWFATALAEQPAGPLAEESFGRLLALRKLRNDLAGAREIAFDYLARYPTGAYAELARGLIEGWTSEPGRCTSPGCGWTREAYPP